MVGDAVAHRWIQRDARRRPARAEAGPRRVSPRPPPVSRRAGRSALGRRRRGRDDRRLRCLGAPRRLPARVDLSRAGHSSSPWATRMPTRGSSSSSPRDSNPRTLTVVSSDRRIRQAASRRRARSLTADQFWELIDDLKAGGCRETEPAKSGTAGHRPTSAAQTSDRRRGPLARGLPRHRRVAGDPRGVRSRRVALTDAEIAEIEREVERETI